MLGNVVFLVAVEALPFPVQCGFDDERVMADRILVHYDLSLPEAWQDSIAMMVTNSGGDLFQAHQL